MKKYLLIGILALSTLALGEGELPENIRKEIAEYTQKNDEKSGRVQLAASEKKAYFIMEDKLANSDLTEKEKDAVRMRLKAMYGAGNYTKQAQNVETQIVYVEGYVAKQKGIKEKQELTQKIEDSKVEMQTLVKENESVIPKKYMDHYKAEATRLYPDNAYEQKRYIESSINTYKKFNGIK